MKYETITYPHECCVTEDCTNSGDVVTVSNEFVKEVLCSAKHYIMADIAELFYYKLPIADRFPSMNRSGFDYHSTPSTKTVEVPDNAVGGNSNNKQYFDYNEDAAHITRSLITLSQKEDARYPEDVEWSSIDRFILRDVASQIRDFIELWQVMPGTKCAILPRDDVKTLRNKGHRYHIDALFSNPTPKCPNPLAVAKVHFYIHVPELMPKYYPVMVTYRFEGFQSTYYALGRKQMRSLEFQRFFIDTILHMKLRFYTELFECRFPQYKNSFDESPGDEDDEEIAYECEEQSSVEESEEIESGEEALKE